MGASTQKSLPSGAYSFQQLEALWIQAGGSPSLAPTMAAIAQAESGGNPNAHNFNPSTGDDSYGLWQINYFGANRPVRTARWGPPDAMYNPLANAKAAVNLSGDSYKGLGNWSTYSNGAFLPYYEKGTGGGVNQAGVLPSLKTILNFDPFKSLTGKTNPVSQAGVNTAQALGIPSIPSLFQKLVAAVVLGGGALLGLLAILLIGADIGLDSRAVNASPARKVQRKVAAIPGARVAKKRSQARDSEEAERRANKERREEERHQQSLKVSRARARELNTRQRHRRRNRQEQEAAERRAYIRGAADRE